MFAIFRRDDRRDVGQAHEIGLRAAARIDQPFLEMAIHVVELVSQLQQDRSLAHLLVFDDGAPSGVIDWGDVHLGATHLDLGIAWGFGENRRAVSLRPNVSSQHSRARRH